MERTTVLKWLKEGQGFTWGEVIKIHEIGEYAIVEYHPWKTRGIEVLTGQVDDLETAFHYYIGDKDTCHSSDSLDSALAGCIAYKHEGANTKADSYFMRMINENIYTV